LEEYETAKKRGAPILAEILGFACNNNGGDLILPNKDGITQTIRLGLESARLAADQIDFVSAHATATKMGDVIEAQAIGEVYGDRPFVTAQKSYMGHTMAACGVIETIQTIYMMHEGFIAPTLHLDDVDKRCLGINHVRQLVEKPIGVAAIQNFAFGGVNTSFIMRKWMDE
jgi:3-oxoacyl-[acyl-carrier-protein] synthase II